MCTVELCLWVTLLDAAEPVYWSHFSGYVCMFGSDIGVHSDDENGVFTFYSIGLGMLQVLKQNNAKYGVGGICNGGGGASALVLQLL